VTLAVGGTREKLSMISTVANRGNARWTIIEFLNKYGYPPDLQDEAVKTVLEQANLLCADWAA